MTMLQYISLDAVLQEEILKECGVYVAGRADDEFIYDLYQIDGFYVEFFYKPLINSGISARAFDDTQNLCAYLQDIDISCLLVA